MVAKKMRLGENLHIVNSVQLSPSKWSYRIYRFYRKTFTVQMRWVFVGVFVCLCGLAFLFSPNVSIAAERSGMFPSMSVCEHLQEEGELRDSTPLFLPTVWNVYGDGAVADEDIVRDENLGFLGNFFLDTNREALALREHFLRSEEAVFEGASRWGLTDSFGERRFLDAEPPIVPGVRMSVVNCGGGERIFCGEIALEGMYEAKMLWAPIEVDCYGEAAYRHFTVTRSSGSAEIDKRVLAFIRMWASKHLREQGKFRFCVGR